MTTSAYIRKSANERSIEELQNETLKWNELIHFCTDEMSFLKQFLSSDVFKANLTDFYEKLNSYAIELEDLQSDKIGVQLSLKHHKNDLNGMLECEDINCDMFYLNQHQDLHNKLKSLLSNFKDIKIWVFLFCDPFLKKIEALGGNS